MPRTYTGNPSDVAIGYGYLYGYWFGTMGCTNPFLLPSQRLALLWTGGALVATSNAMVRGMGGQ